MEIKVDQETISFLREALQEAPKLPRPEQAEREFRKSLGNAWVFDTEAEEILIMLDDRLYDYRILLEKLYLLCGVFFELIGFKPRKYEGRPSYCQALRPEYFVLFLIQLERFGFLTNPQKFVSILLPSIDIKSKTILSSADLEILSYSKFRHKCDDVILYTEKPLLYSEPIEKFKTLNGFKVSFYQKDKEMQMLRIRAPKFRKKLQPRSVICTICGFNWEKGDPESSYFHRKEHKRRLTWLNPEPLPKMLMELEEDKNLAEIVVSKSKLWKHHEMYKRAVAFKREFNYTFIQWSKNGVEEEDAIGFLITGVKGEIVGACAFRNRLQKDNSYRWGLQWIWICPNERGKGHLSKRWTMFRERFGDFLVEPPVSDGMRAFLEKQGDSKLMK